MKFLYYFLKCVPCLSVLLLLMGGSALRIGDHALLPALYLIPIYYWLVFCPDWLPLWSLLGVGLFYDSLLGYELGFSSALLMLSSFLGQYIRPLLIPHSFLVIWGVFCLYSCGYLFLYGLFAQGSLPLVSWIYGVILYPLVAWGLSHLYLHLRSYA